MKSNLVDEESFSRQLYEIMQKINPGVQDLELYEFEYALANLTPAAGWSSIRLLPASEIEQSIQSRSFYSSIKLNPKSGASTIMDVQILELNRMLLSGLVTGEYPLEWIRQHFYFDLRGFYFLHRTEYFSERGKDHLGGKPFRSFEQKQMQFEKDQAVGYKAFQKANEEIDQYFIESIIKLVRIKGAPILVAIAGQTAAGKTEIVARLRSAFESAGRSVTSIEMDHFLTDRDYREQHGIDSMGRAALHFEIFKQCLADICKGKQISTPCYDFITATSSHDLDGNLKNGRICITIEAADIIFIEGNFPFLLEEVAPLIGIKVVYLTDDPVRMKRKWRRDMDYRKKYDLMYFLNRYFREQFLMAQSAYIPQIELCDITVDTTRAAFWATPAVQELLVKTL